MEFTAMKQTQNRKRMPFQADLGQIKRLLYFPITLLMLAACASSANLPNQVIETYYQALTMKDLNTMISLACPEWEEQARNEYNSFGAVTTQLQDLKCETASQDQSKALVTCRGKIIANYGNEVLEIDLSKLKFQVVQRGGNWLFCGYP